MRLTKHKSHFTVCQLCWKNYGKSLEAFALKGIAEIHKQRHENQTAINLLLKAEDLSKNTGDII